MRIAILGAGGTGCYFGARLAEAGHEVSLVARGDHLRALQQHGLTLSSAGVERTLDLPATSDTAALGHQDAVFVGLKATALASAVDALAPLVGPQTTIIFPQNGMPWWYPHGLKDRPAPPAVTQFAIAGRMFHLFGQEQVVGGVVYSANEVIAPGIVRNNSPDYNRIDLGAIAEAGADRAAKMRGIFAAAGLDTPLVPDIRAAVWKKLLVNMCSSVIALATGNKSAMSRRDPELRAIFIRAVGEALTISAAHGYPLDDTVDPLALVELLPDHKPSLLQDYEQHRPMELEQILRAPLQFARAAGLDTPTLDTLSAIVGRLARDRRLLPDDREASATP